MLYYYYHLFYYPLSYYQYPIYENRSLSPSITYRARSIQSSDQYIDFDLINVPSPNLVRAPSFRSSFNSRSYSYDPTYFRPTYYYGNGYVVDLTDDSNILYRQTL